MTIERISGPVDSSVEQALVALLQDAVDSGASVDFLPPLDVDMACRYWRDVFAEAAGGGRIVLVARAPEGIVGTVQLELADKPNASHRAEVQKLLVHSSARRRGIGRALMRQVEAVARAERRSLLVLDTQQGSSAERLYRTLGYTEAGAIPAYARGGDGQLHTTTLFYKLASPSSAHQV